MDLYAAAGLRSISSYRHTDWNIIQIIWAYTFSQVLFHLNVHIKAFNDKQIGLIKDMLIPQTCTPSAVPLLFHFILLLPSNSVRQTKNRAILSTSFSITLHSLLLFFIPLSFLSQETSHSLFALHEQTDCKAADNFFCPDHVIYSCHLYRSALFALLNYEKNSPPFAY